MRTGTALPAGLAAVAVLATACGGTAHRATPTDPAASELRVRAGLAVGRSFVGTYALSSPAGAALATVQVYLDPGSYRVDVVERAATASLYGGAGRETVACTVAASIPTVCYDVSKPGAAVPSRFDIGVERLFRTDLPALAATGSQLTVTMAAADPALTGVAAGTSCYQVAKGAAGQSGGAVVDDGTYCLDPAGLLVGFAATSGVLRLTGHAAAPPTAKQLALPAKPQPLPASAVSPKPTAGLT